MITQVILSHAQDNPNYPDLYRVEAYTEDGRRWCLWDVDNNYPLDITEDALRRLEDTTRIDGGINVELAWWYPGEPIYGSAEYERLGIEQHWAERERAEAGW